jgi:hypothetical protein
MTSLSVTLYVDTGRTVAVAGSALVPAVLLGVWAGKTAVPR